MAATSWMRTVRGVTLAAGLALAAPCDSVALAGGKKVTRAPFAASAVPATQSYRGFELDLSELKPQERRKYFDSLHAQIDLVEGVQIKPEIKDYFRTVTVHVDPSLRQGGHTSRRGLFLAAAEMPPDNPVLLHELLHVYHHSQLSDGRQNADVLRFYQRAKASGEFPAGAYMLSNVSEYFAMTGSVVLYGRASRPPSTRETVKRAQPQAYEWIVRVFGLKE